MFIKQEGDWTKLRTVGQAELDLHPTSPGRRYGPREMPYHQLMDAVHAKTLEALIAAYDEGKESLLVVHGHSTSRPRFWHTSNKNRDVQQGAPIGIPSLVAQLTTISIRRFCTDAENRCHDRQQS
jgi:hypothetical protein